MLDRLGLDRVDIAVYRRLLECPDREPEQLAGELGYRSEEISRALGNLKRLSLVRPSWVNPDRLRPASPAVGLGALLDDQRAELRERHHAFDLARNAVAHFTEEYSQWRTQHRTGAAEFIEDNEAALDRLEELSATAQREICSFSPGTYTPDLVEACRQIDSAALSRGLVLRNVFLNSVNNNPVTRRYANWLAEQGAQLRTSPVLPVRMTIFDRQTAVLPIDPDSPTGVMVMHCRGVLTVLCDHFEQIWDAAIPLGASAEPDDEIGDPSAAERVALKLLAQGLTDEAVARRLDVSLRTVRRMMARLMTMLGTRSRFEAGVRAAKRGWV